MQARKIGPVLATFVVANNMIGSGFFLLPASLAASGAITAFSWIIGTLLAFATVSAGVLVLRYTRADLARPFRVPMAIIICPLGFVSCLYLFWQQFKEHWHLLVGWVIIGAIVYALYGYRHSKLRAR